MQDTGILAWFHGTWAVDCYVSRGHSSMHTSLPGRQRQMSDNVRMPDSTRWQNGLLTGSPHATA